MRTSNIDPWRGGKPPFADFYAWYRDEVLRFTWHYAGPDADAENIAAEAWARACAEWPKITQPRPWIYRVVINLARQAAAERRRTVASGDPYSDYQGRARWSSGAVLPAIGWAERIIDVTRGLQQLPRQQRAAVLLCHDGWSAPEIARVLRCTTTTARVHLHLGRSRLREFLAAEPEPAPQQAAPGGLERRKA
jgi:DNA-directed RNA polymerase specialized sigma24 family protein